MLRKCSWLIEIKVRPFYAVFILPNNDASRILTLVGPFYPMQLSDAVSASSRESHRFDESHRFERSKIAMLDIGMIAIGVGFFVASILYVLACERM